MPGVSAFFVRGLRVMAFACAFWAASAPVRTAAFDDCGPVAAATAAGEDCAPCECVCACGCGHSIRWSLTAVTMRPADPRDAQMDFASPLDARARPARDLNPRPPKA